MPRILIAECKQEVSSFNPHHSRFQDFDTNTGDEMLDFHRGLPTEIGGALAVFGADRTLDLVPAYSARAATSGGVLGAADFQRITDEFLAAIRSARSVDGVYLALHGAMASEDEDDPEGYLLAETRRIVGDHVPLVASFDLHGILTDRILRHCDAITVFHTYPHVDFDDTGARAARLLLRIMAGQVKPVIAAVGIPALVRGDELMTSTGLFGQSVRAARAIEQSPGGLAAGLFIGNPFTDVPGLGSNSFVVTDDDPVTASRAAADLASGLWAVRDRLQASLTSLREAAAIAMRTTRGTVVLTDAADAPSSGATGDSNAILRALREAGYRGRMLVPIVDPPAVVAAYQAGVGEMVRTTVGGRLNSLYDPLPIAAKVRMLLDGDFVNESHGSVWHAGRTAVLEADTCILVVTSRAVHLYDRSLFLACGQDPHRFSLVVVKSPHCQPQFYADWAAVTINVDAPGSSSANLRSLGHTRCKRPIFPLDEEVKFTPHPQVFRRR